jgi:hypothetical protein
MEVNNIDDLIKLAGLVNSQAPTATAESEVEEADCGCSDEQPAAVMTNSPDMYAILKRLSQMGEVHEEEPVAEWSNSPADELTGEPESRIMDLPKGEPVDTSLRRHMGAKAQPVRVEEGIVDHTVEDMMESYAAFKLNEATKGCADCEYMKDETDGEIDTCDECAAEERAEAHKANEDAVTEDAGKVGYVEMFFTDRDGGEVSHEVEVTLKDGKLSITGNMPGPEDDLYYDDADIEEQLRDAMQDMSVIDFGMNEADIEENAFNQAAAAAARAGKDSFEFGGKTHKTTMKKDTAHKLDDDIDVLKQLAGISEFGQVRLPKPEPKTLPGICPPGDDACAVGPRPNPDHPDYVAPDRPPVQPKRPQSLILSKSPAIDGGISSLKKLAGI